MAKLSILGDAVVITSAITLEDIRKIEKFNKGALTIHEEVDGEKTPVFAISSGKTGDINQFGATFASETRDDAKFAQITLCTCAAGVTSDAAEWAAEKFGKALMRLNQLEERVPAILQEIAAEKEAVMANITVVQ